MNVNYYGCITYLILFCVYFKDDCQKEVIFISMRSESPFAVLWVVYFIIDNDLGVYLF